MGLIKSIIKRYEIYIEKDNYKIEYKEKENIIVSADKKRIEQVIYNLINNAMGKNQAWLYIRNKGECKRCLYCWLCPSISNYEFVV